MYASFMYDRFFFIFIFISIKMMTIRIHSLISVWLINNNNNSSCNVFFSFLHSRLTILLIFDFFDFLFFFAKQIDEKMDWHNGHSFFSFHFAIFFPSMYVGFFRFPIVFNINIDNIQQDLLLLLLFFPFSVWYFFLSFCKEKTFYQCNPPIEFECVAHHCFLTRIENWKNFHNYDDDARP